MFIVELLKQLAISFVIISEFVLNPNTSSDDILNPKRVESPEPYSPIPLTKAAVNILPVFSTPSMPSFDLLIG